MKKTRLTGCSLLAALVCVVSTNAWAASFYKDTQAGYQIELPVRHVQIAGPGFIYSGDSGATQPELKKTEKDFQMVAAFKKENLNKLLRHKFTTKEFLQNYADVQLLERSHVDTRKGLFKFYDPANFLTTKEGLLPFDLLKENRLPASYKIKSREEGGRKFLVFSLTSEPEAIQETATTKNVSSVGQPAMSIDISLTSAHDRLYALITAVPENDTSKQLEAELKEHSIFKEKGIKTKYAEKEKARQAYYKNYNTNFLKSFQTMEPVSVTNKLQLHDKILNLHIDVPNDWFYAQYTTTNEKVAANTSFILPMSTAKLIGSNIDQLTTNNYRGLVQESLAVNFADTLTAKRNKELLDNLTEVLAILSYENKIEKPYAEYLKNKAETTKFLNNFFKDLETGTLNQDNELKTVKHEHHLFMDERHGLLNLSSQYALKDAYNLNYDAKIGFSKNKFGSISYLRKIKQDQRPTNNSREKYFQSLQLFAR